jgi:hypothetical protein
MGDTVFVRHRSASARLDSLWEFDPARRCVEIIFRLGEAAPIALCVPVCASKKPRFHAFALTRFDGSSFRLLPIRFVPFTPSQPDRLVHDQHALHPVLDRGTQIILTHCPEHVVAELESLEF